MGNAGHVRPRPCANVTTSQLQGLNLQLQVDYLEPYLAKQGNTTVVCSTVRHSSPGQWERRNEYRLQDILWGAILTWDVDFCQEVGVVVQLEQGRQRVAEGVYDRAQAILSNHVPRLAVDHVRCCNLHTTLGQDRHSRADCWQQSEFEM